MAFVVNGCQASQPRSTWGSINVSHLVETCSGVTPSGRKIYAITQFQSCLSQNVLWRERLATSTGNFRKSWRWNVFFVDHRGTPTCLICTEKFAVYKEYNVRRHYSTRHAEEYTKYQGDERNNRVANLKKCLLWQQDLFKKTSKEHEAAVEASYVVSEMIARAGKPFKEGKFIKSACY